MGVGSQMKMERVKIRINLKFSAKFKRTTSKDDKRKRVSLEAAILKFKKFYYGKKGQCHLVMQAMKL